MLIVDIQLVEPIKRIISTFIWLQIFNYLSRVNRSAINILRQIFEKTVPAIPDYKMDMVLTDSSRVTKFNYFDHKQIKG